MKIILKSTSNFAKILNIKKKQSDTFILNHVNCCPPQMLAGSYNPLWLSGVGFDFLWGPKIWDMSCEESVHDIYFCNTSSTITKCTPFCIKVFGVFMIQMLQNRLYMRSRTRFEHIIVGIIRKKALCLLTMIKQRTLWTNQTSNWTSKVS